MAYLERLSQFAKYSQACASEDCGNHVEHGSGEPLCYECRARSSGGYVPQKMVLYKRPPHYIGATFYGTYAAIGVHRDSDRIVRSNWRVMLARYGDVPGVFVTAANHWAVGWCETLRVDPDEASETTLAAMDADLAALEDYPILDAMDHSELEWTEVTESWARESVAFRVEAIQLSQSPVSIFAARSDGFPLGDDGSLWQYMAEAW